MQDDNYFKNNMVEILGTMKELPRYSHEVYGEKFLYFSLEVPRFSETFDEIPVIISERLIDLNTINENDKLIIKGQFRSYNKHDKEKNHLILSVFTKEIQIVSEEIKKNPNYVFLDGYLCKKPIYRTTPFGREIADILIAVNRAYNKSDYIPLIAWGRNARFSETLQVGDHIKVWGRIQSRKYQKKISNEKYISKMAYEISISKMEIE